MNFQYRKTNIYAEVSTAIAKLNGIAHEYASMDKHPYVHAMVNW